MNPGRSHLSLLKYSHCHISLFNLDIAIWIIMLLLRKKHKNLVCFFPVLCSHSELCTFDQINSLILSC